jgi:hypothetical protein
MIPAPDIPGNAFKKAAECRPQVTRLDDKSYDVVCSSRHHHHVTVERINGTLHLACDPLLCPSRVGCYHRAAVLTEYEFEHLPAGSRVLVSEGKGQVWHTFLSQGAGRVFTREVPEGFSRVFVVEIEPMVEAQTRRAA